MIEQAEQAEHRERLVPVLTEDGAMDERATVFQTWAFLTDRSPSRTAAKVREEFGIEVNPKRISEWSKRHDWDGKARELFEQTAPTFFERTRAALVAAGPPAAVYLRDVVSGTVEKPDRTVVVAAAAVLDRIGFLPYTRREAEKGHSPIARGGSGDVWGELSDDELRAIVATRVSALGPK
jgi:hypothetical protein